jgi:Tfp pilus assembly protein PilN
MKKAAPININLLPKDPFLSTPIGKFLQWALSVGRYLVIFTELIVIVSFASRFTLDRKVTDLNSAILQKKIIIESYGELEKQVRDVQRKIISYAQIEQQQNLADIFPALSEITPQDVILTQLEIQPSSVFMQGTAKSRSSLNLFISNLQLSNKFFDVTIEKIGSEADNNPGFNFRIRSNIRK